MQRTLLMIAATLLLTLLTATDSLLAAEPDAPAEVTILSADNWDDWVPQGKEVDAIYGDIALRNGQLVAVIAQPKATRNANMTVRNVGGCLIDLTTRGKSNDHLSAFYPGGVDVSYRSFSVLDEAGKPVDFSQPGVHQGKWFTVTVKAEGNDQRPEVETSYVLEAGTARLQFKTTIRNTTAKDLPIPRVDAVRADSGNEDMAKSPEGEEETFWFEDRYWGQAYLLVPEIGGDLIRANHSSRLSTLTYVFDERLEKQLIPPEAAVSYTRAITAGPTYADAWSHFAQQLELGVKLHDVTLKVTDAAGQPVPRARVELSRHDEPFGSANTGDDGSVTLTMPIGRYTAKTSIDKMARAEPQEFVITQDEPQPVTLKIDNYTPGTLVGKFTDGEGRAVACKVEIIPTGEGMKMPEFGPPSADFGVKNLRYAPHGEFDQALQSGMYRVIVSHGPEYDALFLDDVSIEPGKKKSITGQLKRTVDTTGWVSGDFHSHSSPSGDNTGSQLGRVLNLVCENIEFAPCTEHNRISSYVPHIESLGIEADMATCSGMELTGQPLPLNHQNVFPLHHHPHEQDGGGPVTDVDVNTQIERAVLWDDRSEKLIQQNHPDIGWLFYDADGDGSPDEGHARGVGFIDVMEIHSISYALDLSTEQTRPAPGRNHRVYNWLQLLNQGYRIPGVVNTDAHYNYHGSGWLRNWIESSTDDPAKIDTLEMVHAAEHGHIIMSNGPYLQVQLAEKSGDQSDGDKTVTAGDDLAAPSGELTLKVRVQCPNWLDIDRVFVLVNGRIHPQHHYRRKTHGDMFGDDVVKFDQTLNLKLDGDAHVIVVAGGATSTLGPVVGGGRSKQRPTALSNPIYVDVDGNGFEPNKDALDHPLPVKIRQAR